VPIGTLLARVYFDGSLSSSSIFALKTSPSFSSGSLAHADRVRRLDECAA
jgi:hypothetical protein